MLLPQDELLSLDKEISYTLSKTGKSGATLRGLHHD